MARSDVTPGTISAMQAPDVALSTDPIIPAIDAFRSAEVAHDWLLDEERDAADPLLAHLDEAREKQLTQLLTVQPTTLAGAAAFALYALEFAIPWADEQDHPMLKAAIEGLRANGVTAPSAYPVNPALLADPDYVATHGASTEHFALLGS